MFPLLGPHDGSFARANDWQEWTRRESYECARGARVQTTVYREQLETRQTAAWIQPSLFSTAPYIYTHTRRGMENVHASQREWIWQKIGKTFAQDLEKSSVFFPDSSFTKDQSEGMQSDALNLKDHQRFVCKNQGRICRVNMQRMKNRQTSLWVFLKRCFRIFIWHRLQKLPQWLWSWNL